MRSQQPYETVGTYTDDYFCLLARAEDTGDPVPAHVYQMDYIEGLQPTLRMLLFYKILILLNQLQTMLGPLNTKFRDLKATRRVCSPKAPKTKIQMAGTLAPTPGWTTRGNKDIARTTISNRGSQGASLTTIKAL